ncbi:MAG TPA: carboxypeptidase-like regulatory domain-containing protein [Verrucomicrobiae bacterium]|nr:carboxypeptidase-like regulatory domain-containing protein [Verrucomicrobiae bacterium]
MSRLTPFFLLFACLLGAQEFRSTLTGRVNDSTGAAVAGARVSAIEQATNTRYDTVSNADGFYTFPLLLQGTYTLTAEVKGFKKYSQAGIVIGTDTRVGQNITLTVGEMTESVTITADAPPLETVKAAMGQVISTHELENLPLDGHTALEAEFFGFGVVNQSNRDNNGPASQGGLATLSMGGTPSGSNEYLLDGVPNIGTQGTTARRPAFLPPPDGVAEVKTEAFNMDAAAGGAAGGTIEMVTKGGTNGLHGAISDYYNNSALQATDFFVNANPGASKAVTNSNQWALAVGGPLWIPHIFNGKNKIFWFFAYEGETSNGPTEVTGTVPTAAERTGDFSHLLSLNSTSKNYTLYDPNTGILNGSVITRTPFPGNIVPSSRLNPIATSFLSQYVPLPNQPGVYDDTNNYGTSEAVKNPYHFFSGRSDINLGSRDKLSIMGRQSLYLQYDNDIFHNLAYLNHGLGRDIWGATIDDVHTFSATLVGDLRVGFTRYDAYYFQASTGPWPDLATPAGGYNPTNLGFPSYIAANANVLQMPVFTSSDGYTLNGNNSGHYTNQPYNVYQAFNSYTKVIGGHTIKFGGEARLLDFTNINWANSTGTYTFDTGTWVKANSSNATAPTMGGSMAQFLLGLPTSGSYPINAESKADAFYYALFIQDDWHVRSDLTFNLGLRWEKGTPSTENHNRQTIGFDFGATNQVTQAAEAAYAKAPLSQLPVSQFLPTGGLLFASSSNRDPYTTSDKEFAPRIGVAWTPKALHERTVLRSGIGIFYVNLGTVTPNQQGFSASTTYVATSNSYLTPATTLSNPFPSGISQPSGSSLGINTFLGQSVSFFGPHYLPQYSVRWNFDIQHQLSKNTTLEVGYIGNHSVHNPTSFNFGSLPAQYLSTSPFRDTATINALAAIVTNPFSGLLPGQSLNGSTTSVSNLLKPYPEFSGVTMSNIGNGSSYFEQLAVRLNKRLANGVLLYVNYSHSRLMEKDTYLNSGSWYIPKTLSVDDRPDVIAIQGTYDLPVGRGKQFLANANKALVFLVGNWQIGGGYSYFQGAPLAWGNLIYMGGQLNYHANLPNTASFNASAFNIISSQQLSNNYRTFPTYFNNLRIDSMNNFNANLTKTFTVHENLKVQFRAEAFNLTNRVVFGAPSLSATSSTFGYITTDTNSPRAIQLALRITF